MNGFLRSNPPIIKPETEKKILEELKQVKKIHGIQILLAVEAGSRAWDIPSQDSDYDIRFIFAYPPEKYAVVNMPPEEISIKDGLFDIQGVDLRGAYKLIYKNEPSVYEWLASEIVYFEDYELSWLVRDAAKEYLDPPTLARYYYGMANRSFASDIRWVDKVKIKKYLYCIRSMLCCNYVLDNREPVPLRMDSLMRYSSYEFADEIKHLMTEKSETMDNARMDKKYALEDQVSEELSALVQKMYGDFKKENVSWDGLDRYMNDYILGKR